MRRKQGTRNSRTFKSEGAGVRNQDFRLRGITNLQNHDKPSTRWNGNIHHNCTHFHSIDIHMCLSFHFPATSTSPPLHYASSKSSGEPLPPQAPPQTNRFPSQEVHRLQPVPQPQQLATRMPSTRSRCRTPRAIGGSSGERTFGRVRRHHQP